MRDHTKEKILDVMEKLFEEQPDMRFGQMVSSLALFAKGPVKSATWDIEDEEFLVAAKRHLENLCQRNEAKQEVTKLAASIQQKAA